MVMDYLVTPYRTQARLNDDYPLVTIRWYFAPPDAKIFPHPHKFWSQLWRFLPTQPGCVPDPDPAPPEPPISVGEASFERETLRSHNPGYKGQCFTGEASWFRDGVPYEVLQDPPTEVDPCCQADVMEGWLVGEGTALPPVLTTCYPNPLSPWIPLYGGLWPVPVVDFQCECVEGLLAWLEYDPAEEAWIGHGMLCANRASWRLYCTPSGWDLTTTWPDGERPPVTGSPIPDVRLADGTYIGGFRDAFSVVCPDPFPTITYYLIMEPMRFEGDLVGGGDVQLLTVESFEGDLVGEGSIVELFEGDLVGGGDVQLLTVELFEGDLVGEGDGPAAYIGRVEGDLVGEGDGPAAYIGRVEGDLVGEGDGPAAYIGRVEGDLVGEGEGYQVSLGRFEGDLVGEGESDL